MVDRADAILVAIPLLAVGGPAIGRGISYVEATLGIGGELASVPFAALGILGAAAVVGHALFVEPSPGGER